MCFKMKATLLCLKSWRLRTTHCYLKCKLINHRIAFFLCIARNRKYEIRKMKQFGSSFDLYISIHLVISLHLMICMKKYKIVTIFLSSCFRMWVQSLSIYCSISPSRCCIRNDDDIRLILIRCWTQNRTWWRHQMETFSVLLAFFAGDSPVTGEFPAQKPVTRSFDVFFYLCLNRQLSKHSYGCWFETPACLLWRHCNEHLKSYARGKLRDFYCDYCTIL